MEAIKSPHTSSKKSGIKQRLAAISVLVAGLSVGGEGLAQQNPDPIPISVSRVVSNEIQSAREKIRTIIDHQDPKDWIIGGAFIGAPLALAGILLRQGRKKILFPSGSKDAKEILDSLKMPTIVPKKTPDTIDTLLEARSMLLYARDIEAIRIMQSKFEGESEDKNITLRDFGFILRLIYTTEELHPDRTTISRVGMRKGFSQSFPSKKKLYEKYFTLLLQDSNISLEDKLPFAKIGKKLDPENTLYKDISTNRSIPA